MSDGKAFAYRAIKAAALAALKAEQWDVAVQLVDLLRWLASSMPQAAPKRPEPRGRHRMGVVYYIENEVDGSIKIGWAVDATKRLRTFQTAHMFQLRILATEPGTLEHERSRHRQFEHCRLSGEWFKAEPDLVEHVRMLASMHQASAKHDACASVEHRGSIQ